MCFFRKKPKAASSPFMKNGQFDVDALIDSMKKSEDPFGLNKAKSEANRAVANVKVGDRFSKSTRHQSGDLVFHGSIEYTVIQVEPDVITLQTKSGDIEKMEREELEGLLGCFLMRKL